MVAKEGRATIRQLVSASIPGIIEEDEIVKKLKNGKAKPIPKSEYQVFTTIGKDFAEIQIFDPHSERYECDHIQWNGKKWVFMFGAYTLDLTPQQVYALLAGKAKRRKGC
jgi:hypothetical protein